MDKQNTVNIKDTYDLYEKTEDFVRVKECYANVGRAALLFMKDEPKYKDYKVIFGAWGITNHEKYYTKHCYLRNGNGEVVDITALALGVDLATQRYIDFFTFSMEEYLVEVKKADLDTSLGYDMMIKMNDKSLEYFEKGLIIGG